VYLFVGLVITLVDIRTLGMFSWPQNAIFRFKWAIYVTNWTALILFTQAVIAAVLATKNHLTSGQSGNLICFCASRVTRPILLSNRECKFPLIV
jgi:hypothetical protein